MTIDRVNTWVRLDVAAHPPVPLDGRWLLRRTFSICPVHGSRVWTFADDQNPRGGFGWADDIYEWHAQTAHAHVTWHTVAQAPPVVRKRAVDARGSYSRFSLLDAMLSLGDQVDPLWMWDTCERDVLLYALADR